MRRNTAVKMIAISALLAIVRTPTTLLDCGIIILFAYMIRIVAKMVATVFGD